MGVTASLQASTVAVTPGSEASVDVRVRNTGHVVDVLHVEVVGEAAAWSVVEPPSVSLFPGNDATVTVRFRPPMAADGPAGAVPFGVRVRSQEDPGGSVVEEGTLDVAPFLAVGAELTPRTSRGRKGAVHELAIDNRGTQPVSVSVAGVDPDANLLFAVEPPTVDVPANSAAFVKVKVRAAKPFRKGTSLTRQFEVVASDAGGQPLAVAAGMFVQEETFPRWVRRALFWAALGLLALLLFWFTLGKPVVESAAKEAVAEEAAATESISDPSAGGSGGGSGDGSGGGGSENEDAGGADVSTGSTGTATGDGSGGVSKTIDGRLFLTEAGVTSYEVPAGSTLQVTDIVLQNPTGDSGALQIRRDGTPLLVVELGNFRDLDYHFVAPIVFSAGQKLELSAACTAGACTPGAYFAGYLVQGG
jgi:hypothetical protein